MITAIAVSLLFGYVGTLYIILISSAGSFNRYTYGVPNVLWFWLFFAGPCASALAFLVIGLLGGLTQEADRLLSKRIQAECSCECLGESIP